jgi:glycine cleavage system regulatory protein
MKPTTPHDPLDDLIAAALHGDLTPDERAQFNERLSNDPAANAAYLEAQAMHDLLEKTHRNAQPNADFEQRMVSGVRRRIASPPHDETAWESLLVLWRAVTGFRPRVGWTGALAMLAILLILPFIALGPITNGMKHGASEDFTRAYLPPSAPSQLLTDNGTAKSSITISDNRLKMIEQRARNGGRDLNNIRASNGDAPSVTLQSQRELDEQRMKDFGLKGVNSYSGSTIVKGGNLEASESPAPTAAPATPMPDAAPAPSPDSSSAVALDAIVADKNVPTQTAPGSAGELQEGLKAPSAPAPAVTPATPEDTRKLIRNAQLDLEVKSFQAAFDQIGVLTKAAGGYVDTSNSQRGGNGKLQGTVVVKVLPQNLDGFLLKLRDLGTVQNQSVSTDDVTKDYYDTQARLDNARRMETQLQDLLKRENGKVSDLLAVERELGRVRGQIEQMQGQLKLYDFQVQYATVTLQVAEKDLTEAAAYVLREQDSFSLYAVDVEGTFQKARTTADTFKAEVLSANLDHNSGSNVSASLEVMVAPDQIEPFLAAIRGLGRVDNFTRQTQRVAKDGGDSTQPADETRTEKDKVHVSVAIRSDDDSRERVALTVVAKSVGAAFDAAKAAAQAQTGAEILSSALNTTPEGASTAQLSVRVPGSEYAALIAAFRGLGRASELTIQRQDNAGPGANEDAAPVIVTLALTDNDSPVQQTDLVITADEVDAQAQALKQAAAAANVEVKSSSFSRQPDGTESAQMTLRLPLGAYSAFLETLKKAGKVESLSVQRNDRPDEVRADDTAPAEINLEIHNQRAIVADNDGLWPTLRRTFGDGLAALFASVRIIGVLIAFVTPWLVALVVVAWIARRIYIRRRK